MIEDCAKERVVLDQKESEEDGTFYMTTKNILKKYNIEIDDIASMEKSELRWLNRELKK